MNGLMQYINKNININLICMFIYKSNEYKNKEYFRNARFLCIEATAVVYREENKAECSVCRLKATD